MRRRSFSLRRRRSSSPCAKSWEAISPRLLALIYQRLKVVWDTPSSLLNSLALLPLTERRRTASFLNSSEYVVEPMAHLLEKRS